MGSCATPVLRPVRLTGSQPSRTNRSAGEHGLREARPSARDVRAADLQEETVKPIGMCRPCVRGGSPDPTKTAAPKRTSQRAERAIRQEPVRERISNTTQPQTNGEAPVKYELTGASCHLRT